MQKRIASLLLLLVLMLNVTVPVHAAEENVEYAADEVRTLYLDANPSVDAHNAYIADLGGLYRVTETTVTQYISGTNGMESYDIWLSSDGINYMSLVNCAVLDTVEYNTSTASYDIPQRLYARYVKLVINRESGKDGVLLTKVEIFGSDGVEEKRIDAEATYSWYDKNPYRTAVDVLLQDPECTMLTDGDTETVITTDEKWATAVIDLKKAYQIGNVDIYTLADSEHFMEGCEIRYSLDGEKFFTYSYYPNDQERTGGIVKNSFSGIPGRNARYLKIILQSADARIAVSDIQVNGYDVEDGAVQTPPVVPLRVEMKNYLLAYLDWSTYNTENASKMALYIEKNPFTDTRGMAPAAVYEKTDKAFTNKYTTKTNLEPQTTYYFALTPFDAEGNEITKVTPVRVKTQAVLGGKVSDTFNLVNHPEYGGGATRGFGSYTEAMKAEAARLMDEIGTVGKNRCWQFTNDTKTYTNIGISTMNINGGAYTQNLDYGSWLYSNGNESDLSQRNVNEFLNDMKNSYRGMKQRDPRMVLCNPVLGGTEPLSLNWFDRLYQAGNGIETKNNFDVVDVHLYTKSMDEQIPGLPVSAPETLYKKIANVREVMARYDDVDKPIISTEIGYQTSNKHTFIPNIDYETQRDWIVRMYLIMISAGVKEAWYYDFQDDGLDLSNPEHGWGLVDYFGVPKPSYYGFYNMTQQLRYAEYLGRTQGMSNPYYGCEFYDQQKGKNISAIWAADGQAKSIQFETCSGEDEKIEIIGCDGSFRVVNTEGGLGSASIGRGPIFLYSESGIKVNSIDVSFAIDRTAAEVVRGEEASFQLTRRTMGQGVSGHIEASGMPEGWSLTGSTEFDSTQQSFAFAVQVPENAAELTQNFVLNVVMDHGITEPVNISVTVKPSVEITFLPKPVEFGKWDQWQAAAICTNVADIPVNGSVSLLSSSGITFRTMEAQRFDALQPGQSVELLFDVDKPAEDFGAVGSFVLEVNGQRRNIDRKLNFSACVNDGAAPTIDGTLSAGEWDSCQVISEQSYRPDTWAGNSDLSFKLYRKWDAENFYIAVDVTDDVLSAPLSGSEIWGNDGVQIGLDVTRKDGVSSAGADYFEFGFSPDGKGGLLTWVWSADLPPKKDRALGSYRGAYQRTEGHTVYEIAIPWGFFTEKGTVNTYDCLGFSVVVNDNDGAGRKFLTYMSGIASSKDANEFEDMVMVKK